MAAEIICRADEQEHPFSRIHGREFTWYIAQRVGDKPAMRRLSAELNELCDRFGLPDRRYGASRGFHWGAGRRTMYYHTNV
jgi:hypothetical protein